MGESSQAQREGSDLPPPQAGDSFFLVLLSELRQAVASCQKMREKIKILG